MEWLVLEFFCISKGVLFFMNKEVMIFVGAGQIGMAIARRMGFGKK